jgi:predicted negative regulator of RcsB-dependent stress response
VVFAKHIEGELGHRIVASGICDEGLGKWKSQTMRLVDIYRARWDGRPEIALKAADERLAELENEQSPQWKEMWLRLMHIKGDCYLDLKDYTAAEQCFTDIYSKYCDPIALVNRGYTLWLQGRLEEAKQDYLRSITLPGQDDENNEISFRQLARICLEMQDIGEAEAFLFCARQSGFHDDQIEIQKEIDIAKGKVAE